VIVPGWKALRLPRKNKDKSKSATVNAFDFPSTITAALEQIPDEPRPFLYGCSVYWGEWYGLTGEEARAWNTACFDALVRMGATSVSVMGSGWHDIERVPGTYNWETMDWSVEAARSRGLVVFAYTGLTPEWALPPVAKGKGWNHRFPPEEEFAPQFEQYCEALARRYRGKITYYEFWNEENGCGWIREGCRNSEMAATYVPWLKRWYRAMKRGDPDCVLALGGLDYHSGVEQGYLYLDAVYDAGGGDFFDHVAIHPYGEPLHWRGVRDIYGSLVRHGQGYKRVWINEYGWNLADEETKSRYLAEVLDRLARPEYRFVFHACYVSLTDLERGRHDFGLCDGAGDLLGPSPRPSFETFAAFAGGQTNASAQPAVEPREHLEAGNNQD